jgi:hypothetical protein
MRRARSSCRCCIGAAHELAVVTHAQERLKEKFAAKQRAANAVHAKEKELTIAEELCSSLKQDIQVCKAATKEIMGKVEEVRSRRAQQDTPGMQVRCKRDACAAAVP